MVKGAGRKPVKDRSHKDGTNEEMFESSINAQAPGAGAGAGGPPPRRTQDDDESEGEEQTKKPPKSLLQRDDNLDAELDAQFGFDGGLTRKQREELERQQQEREEEKAKKNGETDEAKADMERLAEIRRKREEERVKKEQAKAEADAKASTETSSKAAAEPSGRAVAVQIAKIAKEASEGKCTLNFLNQDATCKKVLKPLCKKEGVKAINKAWLSKFPDLLNIKEAGNDLTISPKA
mmetsp:Transcript_103788/g.317839  ORF Transcript_103788/g.317839 Transcript_103788/m.317839 type:complete len:236 (-) Transcript_103788:200-907(-)